MIGGFALVAVLVESPATGLPALNSSIPMTAGDHLMSS
jgi:hypothetical protein